MASRNAAQRWPSDTSSAAGMSDQNQGSMLSHSAARCGSSVRMAWPATNANGFTRQHAIVPQMQAVKMIRAPDVYVATHDTMPPRAQVLSTVPTHDMLRQLYQQADRKIGARKRETTAAESELDGEPRPVKTPRSS